MPKDTQSRVKTIARRSMAAAQMAVTVRSEAKHLRKNTWKVPPYYAQNFITLISRTSENTCNIASAALAGLEYYNLSGGKSNSKMNLSVLKTAEHLSHSAAQQALSAKSLFEALVATSSDGGEET